MNGEISLSSFTTNLKEMVNQNDGERVAGRFVHDLMSEQATNFIYSTLSLSDRREHGIFFSGETWPQKILAGQNLSKWNRFIDPSVGVGDLLIEVCKNLPLKSSVKKTLESWSQILIAIDLRKSFLEIAWIRIQVMAAYRHQIEKKQKSSPFFMELPENFIVGDFLSIDLKLRENDCIVMNPPYQRINSPSHSYVGKGLRSAAALHLEHVLAKAPKNVGIFALIPDVLRSGSSYKNFRKEIKKIITISSFEPAGAFGIQADVDVAILIGCTTQENITPSEEKVNSNSNNNLCVGDFFDISVGAVVPHRTPTTGDSFGYITVKNSIVGAEVSSPNEFATYACRLERGPFVVVRRTSSPSDKKRARSTIINTKELLLVENHLLLLKPKDKSISMCRSLINTLSDSRTDEWLNQKIRCRHLTVEALKEIPWISLKKE